MISFGTLIRQTLRYLAGRWGWRGRSVPNWYLNSVDLGGAGWYTLDEANAVSDYWKDLTALNALGVRAEFGLENRRTVRVP